MGNACECVTRQTDDDAVDALLAPDFDGDQPRGPPPPYQPRAPLYAYAQMTEEQRIQLVQRLTLIQCLPCGRYADTREEKEKKSLEELEDDICTSSGHGEKKGDKDRECPICMLDFVVGQPIRLLPCMHYYHMRCIDDWLMRSLTCPTCMERVDVGVRNTVISSRHSLRRRRVGSSSSTMSTISTASSSSVEQVLTYGPTSPTSSDTGSSFGFGHQQGPQLQLRVSSPGQRQRNQNQNEMQQQPYSHSPIHSPTNPLTLNLDQIYASSVNSRVVGGTLLGGVSPPGSPIQQTMARGTRRHGDNGGRGVAVAPPQRPPPSPPLIEFHYEYRPLPSTPTHGHKSFNSSH